MLASFPDVMLHEYQGLGILQPMARIGGRPVPDKNTATMKLSQLVGLREGARRTPAH
jgi:hypothetical protein